MNKKQLIILVILIVGLLIGLFLVQRKQIFKSKATSDVNQAISIPDSEYQGNNTYKLKSRSVHIDINQ